MGTNQNEILHRILNNSPLAVCRIGPELAIALLTVILYKWNFTKENGESGTVPILPVWASLSGTHVRSDFCIFRVEDKHNSTNCIDHNRKEKETKSMSCHKREEVTVEETVRERIIKRSLNMFSFFQLMQINNCPLVSVEYFCWASLNNFGDIFNACTQDTVSQSNGHLGNESRMSGQLKDNVELFGLVTIEVQRDGDCLFRSVAVGLLSETENDEEITKNMKKLGLPLEVGQLCETLRQMAVQEIGDN
jgi:hypothetical protein